MDSVQLEIHQKSQPTCHWMDTSGEIFRKNCAIEHRRLRYIRLWIRKLLVKSVDTSPPLWTWFYYYYCSLPSIFCYKAPKARICVSRVYASQKRARASVLQLMHSWMVTQTTRPMWDPVKAKAEWWGFGDVQKLLTVGCDPGRSAYLKQLAGCTPHKERLWEDINSSPTNTIRLIQPQQLPGFPLSGLSSNQVLHTTPAWE